MCRNQHDRHKYEEFVKTAITNLSAFWYLFVFLFVCLICLFCRLLFICLFVLSFFCVHSFFFCSVPLSVLCLFLYFVYFVSY